MKGDASMTRWPVALLVAMVVAFPPVCGGAESAEGKAGVAEATKDAKRRSEAKKPRPEPIRGSFRAAPRDSMPTIGSGVGAR
jgi:hypothetical protein